MTRPHIRRLVYLLFAVTLVSHAAGFAAWLAVRRDFWRADDAREQAREAERRVSMLLSAVVDAEAGQRGYLITARPAYLEPYLSGRQEVMAAAGRLRRAAHRRPELAARLDDIDRDVASKLTELEDTVARVARGDKPGAYTVVGTDRGKLAMDRVRVSVVGLLAEADAAAEAAEADMRQAQTLTLSMVVTGKTLTAVLFVALYAVSLRPARPTQPPR